jgi:hypothetical protein
LSRIINPEGAAKERTLITRAVVLALRELMRQQELSENSRDLAAFIGIALQDLYATVDSSVGAWEKRGYWVKAERFRMEWEWTQRQGGKMVAAVLGEDWGVVAQVAAITGQKLMKVDVPVRHKIGTPWVGAYQQLLKTAQSRH